MQKSLPFSQISQAEKSNAMVSSRCLQSEEPFKTIWVAAYFHSKLKKSQIVQTDIVSTVDKLLQDDFGVITYRVLAYLLLGVVRIQSKKYGYMSNDCREVVNRIKEFISKKQNSHADTLHAAYNSITLPDRFELDAFDLGIVEDCSRSNVMPNEAITLKDTAWKNLGMVQFSLDKCQFEFSAANQDSHFLDDGTLDEVFLSPYMMDNGMEVRKSNSLSNLEASLEKFRDIKFSEEECVHLDKFYGVEEEPPVLAETVDENCHNDGKKIKVGKKMADLKVESPMETNTGKLGDWRLFPEDCLNHEEFTGFHEKHSEIVKPFGKDCLNMIIPEVTPLECVMSQVIEEDTDHSNLLISMEKHQTVTFSREELPSPDIFCRAEEEPAATFLQHDEENHHIDALHKKDIGRASSEHIKRQINTEGQPSSFTPDVASKPKFSDSSACTTPKYMVLTTPTTKKPIQRRKRKCIIDESVVLSNQVMKRMIEDPSDLVSKRRKVRNNSFPAWKAYRISSFRNSFSDPLLNCLAVELKSLFCTSKFDILECTDIQKATEDFPESAEIVEPSTRILESAEIIMAAEKILASVETSDTPPNATVSVEEPQIAPETPIRQTPTVRFMEEPKIAPETPIQQTSLVRSVETFTESPFNSDAVRPASLCASTQNYASSSEDRELDISLINEEISSRYEEQGVSPERTRIARIFRRRSKEEKLNLSHALNGKTKKDSARLFYEILVLKSVGYLDVEQNRAYGDIHVRILPRWEQIDGNLTNALGS